MLSNYDIILQNVVAIGYYALDELLYKSFILLFWLQVCDIDIPPNLEQLFRYGKNIALYNNNRLITWIKIDEALL